MKPWIILTAISLILDVFNILKAVAGADLVDAVASSLGWLLGAYFFLVVSSFKAQVEEGVEGDTGYKREERLVLKA